jgi:hypothetical protein
MKLCGASKAADMEKDEDDNSETDFDSDEEYECDGKTSDDDNGNIGDDRSATDDNANLLLPPPSPCANSGTVPAFASAVTPVPVSPSKQIQDARIAISEYEKKVAELKHRKTVLQRKNRYLTRENNNLRSNNGNESGNEEPQSNLSRNDHFKIQISGALNTVLDRHRCWKGPFVAKVLWDYLDGALQPHLLKLARIHFRTHVFTSFNIIREMDLAGGTLSFEGMDVIQYIAEYLYKWKNLYRISQQGWEAMNSLINKMFFFFRRTSHGGGVRGNSKKSRLIPIARWLQRWLIFLCRFSEEAISRYAKENPIPNDFSTQAASQENDAYG